LANSIDRYGVMGYPVSHSRSPVIHRLFALQTGQELQYELLQVAPEKLTEAVFQFRRTGGKGLNITLPHKAAACELVDRLTDRAARANAVNTLAFEEDIIFGDNTDGVGLIRDLTGNLEIELKGVNILILGAGGATRGILGPLCDANPSSVLIANRTLGRAADLADRFSSYGAISACTFANVRESDNFDLIINATSTGLNGEVPPYPEAALNDKVLCYDLSYGLSATPFSRWATEHGVARSMMGWGMLVEQAAESFNLWRGVRPDTAVVLEQLTVSAS
jgi:shikimate dehydrogenase